MRDYQLISPSLEGVLSHSTVLYEGVERPTEIMRIFDGPASRGARKQPTEAEEKILGQYFQDLYSIFMKKLAAFATEPDTGSEETIKLQALLQEMIKVKKMVGKGEIE
jgi:hypothetical protein